MRYQARLEVLATPSIRKQISYDCAQEALVPASAWLAPKSPVDFRSFLRTQFSGRGTG